MGNLCQIAARKRLAWGLGWVLACLGFLPTAHQCDAKPDGELVVEIVDSKTAEPVPSRIHLRNARGRTLPSRGWGLAELDDHAYIDGSTTLGLKRGAYRFDLDPGPEYRTLAGHFEIERDANDIKKIEVTRFANLADEGWYSADLGVLRDLSDHEILERAEQLAYLANLGWQRSKGNDWEPAGRIAKGRQPAAGSSARWSDEGGVVWLHDPSGKLTVEALPQPTDDSTQFLNEAKSNGWLVFASATSWELPLWIAHDLIDAILVIDGWSDSKPGKAAKRAGRQPTERRFLNKRGTARWREAIYHQLLEAGIAIPPVAISGSGLNDVPAGSSRTYFFSREEPQRPSIWNGLLSGASVITNGPLLRPFVEGRPPGVEFQGEYPREVQIGLNMATRSPVDYLEIIQNGQIAKSVRLMDWAAAGGKLPLLNFDRPGWFVVRAVTNDQKQYQFASTAPYYVGNRGDRISTLAVQFFLDWLAEYAKRFEPTESASYQKSLVFWKNQLVNATAD